MSGPIGNLLRLAWYAAVCGWRRARRPADTAQDAVEPQYTLFRVNLRTGRYARVRQEG